MLRELARPLLLILCIVSLLAAFEAAFFEPATGFEQRALDALELLALSGAICVLSGMVFRDAPSGPRVSQVKLPVQVKLRATLPVQLFFWGSGVMVVLFLLAWYLEVSSVFDGHVRY